MPRGRGGNRGGEKKEKPRDVQISTAMSMVLRHNAAELLASGIRDDGFCRFSEMLGVDALKELECTKEDLERVVRECPKKRFELAYDDDKEYEIIRATQGHSLAIVQDDKLLQRLESQSELPAVCVHGTYRQYLVDIQRFGLLAGGGWGQNTRRHIHFVGHEPGGSDPVPGNGMETPVSGLRPNIEIAIWIDIKRAIEDGVPFFASRNGVIVSPGIDGRLPAEYILKVKDMATGKFIENPEVAAVFDAEAFEKWKEERLEKVVRTQVEFYFSDDNYSQDEHLQGQADKDGWVALDTVANFNRIKNLELPDACAYVCHCLRDSDVVEVSAEDLRIRQRRPKEAADQDSGLLSASLAACCGSRDK